MVDGAFLPARAGQQQRYSSVHTIRGDADGKCPLVPYYRPGDKRIAQDLAELAADNQAFLLANHGPVVCGESLQEAANNMEELEETAKLIFILGDRPIRYLTAGEIAELRS